MDVIETIFARRTIPVVRPDSIPRDVVECLLAAAAQAPNHHKVRPWRFIVLQGAARERLGAVMAESLHASNPEMPQAGLDKESTKPLRAPLLIAVGVDLPQEPRVELEENICAAAAAVENLLLAAQSLGLGAIWRSGAAISDPNVKVFLGLQAAQPLIGILYIGYPAPGFPIITERPSFEDRTIWME
jgi:nitroreductase